MLKAQRPSRSEICSRHKGRVGLKFAQGTSRCCRLLKPVGMCAPTTLLHCTKAYFILSSSPSVQAKLALHREVGLALLEGVSPEARAPVSLAFAVWWRRLAAIAFSRSSSLLSVATNNRCQCSRDRRWASGVEHMLDALQHAVLDEARSAILVIDAVARADCALKLAVGHRCVSVGRSSRSSYRFS